MEGWRLDCSLAQRQKSRLVGTEAQGATTLACNLCASAAASIRALGGALRLSLTLVALLRDDRHADERLFAIGCERTPGELLRALCAARAAQERSIVARGRLGSRSVGQWLVYALILLHVLGTAWHVDVRRDGALDRMLPQQNAGN